MSADRLGTSRGDNAEAWFIVALRPRKPEGSLGRTAQDGHLDSHTAPELCGYHDVEIIIYMTTCWAPSSRDELQVLHNGQCKAIFSANNLIFCFMPTILQALNEQQKLNQNKVSFLLSHFSSFFNRLSVV